MESIVIEAASERKDEVEAKMPISPKRLVFILQCLGDNGLTSDDGIKSNQRELTDHTSHGRACLFRDAKPGTGGQSR